MFKPCKGLIGFTLLLSGHTAAFSHEISVTGTVDYRIQTLVKTKSIKFLEYTLSENARQKIHQRIEQGLQNLHNDYSDYKTSNSSSTQLGMNQVPVLDQGAVGTCVTFAVTAAIDAVLGKGDYVSQLCELQLGNYLAEQNKGPSGWDGSWGELQLNRISSYGVISKSNQHEHGCGGLLVYPYFMASTGSMSPDDFSQYSESISPSRMTWATIFDGDSLALDANNNITYVPDVKAALDAGNRVVFGTMLGQVGLGTSGAVGWHYMLADTWVLTDQIEQELSSNTVLPGHEMIITGYDDDAVAMDMTGARHKGLFTLRNSWGYLAGALGEYYMTYDYFNALATEAYTIKKV